MMNKESGFTLVELMVGIALGLFVVLGTVTATANLLNRTQIGVSQLDQTLRDVSFNISRELMRAGYRGDAATGLAPGADAYVNPFGVLDVSQPGCVLYSYDANGNGIVDKTGTDERRAFVLSQGVLYARTGGAVQDCDVTAGTWEPLTDPAALTVTSFQVSVVDTATAITGSAKSIHQRTVSFKLSGASMQAKGTTQSVSDTLTLPNDTVS